MNEEDTQDTDLRHWLCKARLNMIKDLQIKSISKIVVATMQIILGFAPVLNIQMPDFFRSFLGIMSIFNFDITVNIGIGCFADSSYATSLATSVALVIAVVALVGAVYVSNTDAQPHTHPQTCTHTSLRTDSHTHARACAHATSSRIWRRSAARPVARPVSTPMTMC